MASESACSRHRGAGQIHLAAQRSAPPLEIPVEAADRHTVRRRREAHADTGPARRLENARPGEYMVRYKSGTDLLMKTPLFYQQVMRDRLSSKFNRVYRYIEVLFDGNNPYIDAIASNINPLVRILETGDWTLLRRQPPYFLGIVTAVQEIEQLVSKQLASLTYRFRIDVSR